MGQQSSQPHCLGGSCALTDGRPELLQRPHCSAWQLQPLECAPLSQLWSLPKLQQGESSSPQHIWWLAKARPFHQHSHRARSVVA